MEEIVRELKKLEKMVAKEAPTIIGVEAVNHFTENFEKQSFDGKPWKDVKRRDASSTWYGFSYGAKSPLPANHPRRKGAKKKYKARKKNATTHFSPVARKTPVLSSRRAELENSLTFRVKPGRVVIASDKPYADVHNAGGKIKVFGKKTATVDARPFVGKSKPLDKKIEKVIDRQLGF